ncbi:MAG: hypothetical protein GY950_17495, partial [bacterium]|nr:hypothetical protein [bacterium]
DFLLFIEGGYAYQVVKKLSGKGSENSPDGSFYWEGDWNIINVSGSEEWGTINALYPSNYWEEGMSKSRDFKLDLSGFQLKGGIAYRF